MVFGSVLYIFAGLFLCLNRVLNPLSTSFTKWSNTLKQFVGKLPPNCMSVVDHFVGLPLKGLSSKEKCFLFHSDSSFHS